jgi:hypothetical protein
MKRTILLIVPLLLSLRILGQQHQVREKYDLYYQPGDPSAELIDDYVAEGMKQVASFLHNDFKHRVTVRIFTERQRLDEQWQKAWGAPGFKSECWMVGSGSESQLDLLSPSVWGSQACEHDGEDRKEIRLLVVHELVHVLHSDYCKSPAFDNINNIDWLVEGLATYVSGQLDEERMKRTIAYVKATGGPESLSLFWTGQHKYGLSGTLVAYIDHTYGRKLLADLMVMTDLKDMLQAMQTTEKGLIEGWKRYLSQMK